MIWRENKILALNYPFSWLSLQVTGIIGVCHHIQLRKLNASRAYFPHYSEIKGQVTEKAEKERYGNTYLQIPRLKDTEVRRVWIRDQPELQSETLTKQNKTKPSAPPAGGAPPAGAPVTLEL